LTSYRITFILIITLEEVEGDEDISAFVSEANAIIAESNTLLEAK
jgi:hypothetical protein